MYFITVSEMLGTKGEEIAKKAAQAFGYTYCGADELYRAADEMGFLSDVEKADEKAPGPLERFFSERPRVYLDRLHSVIYELAKKGNAVFFGKGSQLLLGAFGCALHILVTGSLSKRIERLMEEKKITGEVAERLIRQSDHEKSGFFRFAFDQDWLNPSLYDLVLNTDKLSIESALKIITNAARSDEIKACGLDAVKSLGSLSLQRKIEAALLEAGLTNQYLSFEVEDPESVRLYGTISSEEKKEEIEILLKKIKGIRKINNNLVIYKGAVGAL